MNELQFRGKIKSGLGKHKKLVIPSKTVLRNVPENWPVKFYPGSLNIKIDENGYPDNFHELGQNIGVMKFDEGLFPPCLIIPKELIVNNTKGDGQVWLANICTINSNDIETCWVLRRKGSSVKKQLEIISEHCLREKMKLEDGMSITVLMYSK